MGNKPKVSVIMPNYNGQRYIGEAIESILNQTYRDLELIIVDDGSTDSSNEVVNSYGDKRIRLMHQKHSGKPSIARNRGLRESRGKFIAFLDSDDTWKREKLELQVNYIEKNKHVALVHSDFELINSEGKQIAPSAYDFYRLRDGLFYKTEGGCFKELCYRLFIRQSSAVVRKAVLDQVGLFDESLQFSEEYDLYLRIAKRHLIGFIDVPLCTARRHNSNMTNDHVAKYISVYELLKRIETWSNIRREVRSLLKFRFWELSWKISFLLLEKGRYEEGLSYFFGAVKHRPLSLINLAVGISYLLRRPEIVTYLRSCKDYFWQGLRYRRRDQARGA